MKLIVLMVSLALVGCASQPPRLVSDQYCHTSQTIKTENGENVSSQTTLRCSDDPIEKYAPAKMGIAKDCYSTTVLTNRGREKIYVCKKFNGTYDVIESVRIQ
jgi:hypothetical protein